MKTSGTSFDQRKAIATAIIHKIAEGLTDDDVLLDLIEAYRMRIPVTEIAKKTKASHPEIFTDQSIPMIAGAIRVKIRELVPEKEREEIEFEHRSKAGTEVYSRGKGISGLSPEELSYISKLGGKNSGTKAYAHRLGVFALSKEEQLHNAKLGGAASHAAKGHTPWSKEPGKESNGLNELELCIYLSSLERFQHQMGKNKGKPDNQKIADELNRAFHNGSPIRTAMQVNIRRSKEKAKLKE